MKEPAQPSKVHAPTVTLGPDFFRALEYANSIHAADTRKGRDIPYVSHLLAVAASVLELGGDEELAIAALLHDTVEDHPDVVTFGSIEKMFGPRAAKVVEGCSDTHAKVKEDWCLRKTRYLAHLR